MGVARTVYIRRAVSCVLSSSSLHATSCILFGISTSSPFPPFPPFPPYLHISNPHLVPPVSVRHVGPTLSISLFDTSIRRCPFLSDMSVRRCPSRCLTRPSNAICLPDRHVHLTLSVLVRHVRLTRSLSLSDTSIGCCRSLSPIPVPVPVPVPIPFRFAFPFPFDSHSHSRSPPLPLPLPLS